MKQTLLGVSPAPAKPEVEPQPAQRASGEAVGQPARTGFVEEPRGQPQVDGEGPKEFEEKRAPAKLPAKSDRTMLGITPLAVAQPPEPTPAKDDGAWAEVGRDSPSWSSDSAAPAEYPDDDAHAPDHALRWLWLAVGALTVLAIGGAILLWLTARDPGLRLRVVSAEGVELLEVEAPGYVGGAKLRFQGVEQPLEAGRARFPLKADALKIGENKLTIDLIADEGEVESSTVNLRVAYRVRLDTAGLSSDPPQIALVVDAMPGSKVSVDGQPLALDDNGRGVRTVVVEPQAGGVFAFTARYRVEPPKDDAEDGKIELSLPVVSMQIDRPGPEVVTDKPVLEIAGAVEPTASVQVDGADVPVHDGRFLHRVELGELGERVLRVVARLKGKAPRVAELRTKRVEDLALAAASFTPDPSLSYAKIVQKPVMYRGQKVAFDGRVYNVEVDAGRSVLQMLVLDCPGATRCPLWVEYSQATDATIDSRVRVLGMIAGEQQFRSKQGQVQTVPSVQAEYVLDLAK